MSAPIDKKSTTAATTNPVTVYESPSVSQVLLDGDDDKSSGSSAATAPPPPRSRIESLAGATNFKPTLTQTSASTEAVRASGFEVGVAEDRNRKHRRTMEDAHCFVYRYGGVDGQGFFAIFDGHAGKAAAEWCGANLHETLLTLLQEKPSAPIPELLNEAFVRTDAQLSSRKLSSGCTAVVAFTRIEDRENQRKRVLYTANVGDARAVLSRDGKAVRLTYDHKGSDRNEAQRIMESGGFVVNNRVNGVLAVTRALGDATMKDYIIGNPFTTETVLEDSDSLLVLACDGLWDVCSDEEAVAFVHEESRSSVQTVSEDLMNLALEKFSTDNLSVMVIRFTDQKVFG
ncbi:Protein phosphatase 2C 1 [Rhizoclosmatium sp. JEL0117]|nr:Protein phosphatase 2C 1 [Rhizoclosmatium sp. JEL0117]